MNTKSKIALCNFSIGEEYKKRTKLSTINKQLYCEKHGYDFIEDDNIYNKSKTIHWSKIFLFLKYLDSYDWLVWIDSDIFIMNDNITLESFIDKYGSDHDMIIGSDWRMPNTGVWFVKNCEFSKLFLQAVWDNVYDPNEDPKERYLNFEQGSVINCLDKNVLDCKKHIKIAPPEEINSYWYSYFVGHFVLHFAGVRGELLQYLLRDHCPNRMDVDTDESYKSRMEWLAGPIRNDFDEKLKFDKENERKGMFENPIEYVSQKEYLEVIDRYNYLFDALLNIVRNTGEEFEGNCFFYHKTFDKIKDHNKAINLYSIGKSCGNDILEIGFNAGHSCLLFLLSNPNNKIDCFDICEHSYSQKCFEYLSNTFPGRITLNIGDSKSVLPIFKKENPEKLYNIIHIDGSHEFNDANCDFYNTLHMTKNNSYLIFDDINLPQMKYLWDGYVRDNHVKEIYSPLVETYPHVIAKYIK